MDIKSNTYTPPTVKIKTLASSRRICALSITGTTESTDSDLENPEMGNEGSWD